MNSAKIAFGTGGSVAIDRCQICAQTPLEPIVFLGYLPPVNQMPKLGERPREQSSYPAQLLLCPRCHLVQLGLVVDAKILFPPDYPYRSGTTRILRENFAELYKECFSMFKIGPSDLVVDIGSNDGTLLSNFQGKHRVLGVTPEDAAKIAIERGIPTLIQFFTPELAEEIRQTQGKAKVVTAANVFAHIENVNRVIEGVSELLDQDGIFVSESHYLLSLVETLQYDTIYHEHLRYYSLTSLKHLLEKFGLQAIHARRIPTHGGSIRVYAARPGVYQVRPSVQEILRAEKAKVLETKHFVDFREKVMLSKLGLQALLNDLKRKGKRVYGIGAPSRASTLVCYVGIDDAILDCVVELKGSQKIGRYMPGTLIPVLDETQLYQDQPEYALVLSWHIADELIPKIRQQGFRGDFIVPLPTPRIVSTPPHNSEESRADESRVSVPGI